MCWNDSACWAHNYIGLGVIQVLWIAIHSAMRDRVKRQRSTTRLKDT